MAQAREIKNSIQMGHFTNIAAMAAQIADGDRTAHVIGYVAGKAKGVSYRANPNGDEPSIGITGIFEGISCEEGRAVMVSNLIFLPHNFSKLIAAQLQGDQKAPTAAPPKGKSIDLAGVAEIPLSLEIGIRKNTGAGVGYEFAVVSMGGDDPKAHDALAEVRALLPANVAKFAAPAMLPAPEVKAAVKPAKGKKK